MTRRKTKGPRSAMLLGNPWNKAIRFHEPKSKNDPKNKRRAGIRSSGWAKEYASMKIAAGRANTQPTSSMTTINIARKVKGDCFTTPVILLS